MERFLLLVRADLERLKKLQEDKRYSDWPDMVPWVKSLTEAGKYVTGAPLTIAGRHVAKGKVLSDGPFIESKEGVLGFDIILAKSFDDAVAIALTCPMVKGGFAAREVRQIAMLER
ncbi:MAG TPA: YciI family protein [Cyclobacteriaceae bacterium]|nr:YciI family protein [Cyclobacteriaceae bacterium]